MGPKRESWHEVSLGGLAKVLGVRPPALHRLERAGLLQPIGTDAEGERRYSDRDYARLRLYLDLVEAGATMEELRAMAGLHEGAPPASRAAARLVTVVDALLRRLQGRLDRLRALRADLIGAREALVRCHSCHRPVAALACRTCSAMPSPLPRTLDKFFSAQDRNSPRAPGQVAADAPTNPDPPPRRTTMQQPSLENPDVGQRLDVRAVPPPLRHQTIFAMWEALAPGASFTLCNDHDPRPLYYQLSALHAGELDWEYLERGPEIWRVRIGRTGGA